MLRTWWEIWCKGKKVKQTKIAWGGWSVFRSLGLGPVFLKVWPVYHCFQVSGMLTMQILRHHCTPPGYNFLVVRSQGSIFILLTLPVNTDNREVLEAGLPHPQWCLGGHPLWVSSGPTVPGWWAGLNVCLHWLSLGHLRSPPQPLPRKGGQWPASQYCSFSHSEITLRLWFFSF